MEIDQQVITFDEVRNGIELKNDPYGIGAYALSKNLKKTFLEVPVETENEPMIIIATVDGVIAGRSMKFPSRLRVNGDVIKVTSGSSLFVEEKYRPLAIGASLFMYSQSKMRRPIISAGISSMAEPIYKKTKYTLFDIPAQWQIRNIKPVLQSLGIKRFLLDCISLPINVFLKIFNSITACIAKRKTNRLTIERLEKIPEWAEDMVLNDSHKYAEYHDGKWMQWVLDNNFFGHKEDRQAFYAVYKDKCPIGFYMVAERVKEIKEKNIKKVVFGSLLEWQTIDESLLSEYMVIKLALSSFTKNVDIVSIATQDPQIRRKLLKFGFVRHGKYNIGIKDVAKQLEDDYKDINNWRIRSSYADTPFY